MLAHRSCFSNFGDEMLPRPCRSRRKNAAGVEFALFLGFLAIRRGRSFGIKERKIEVSKVKKRVREKKKSNGRVEVPPNPRIQQGEEGKQSALSKEKAAATCLERRKRKKNVPWVFEFRHYAPKMLEMSGGRAEKERERGAEAKNRGGRL